jgi:tetraprenyl-beta-curcumene synthase
MLVSPPTVSTRLGAIRLFAQAARRYWLEVFPVVRSAQRELLRRAEAIPDPLLREDAIASHRDKGSNSEGLAALAVLAPAAARRDLARSLVAYQLMLDYLDCVSERPAGDPLGNGACLHRAFEVALDPAAAHADYYELAPCADDGGYLVALIEACRAPLRRLPSLPVVQDRLLRQARLCRESQALNHAQRFAPIEERLSSWAREATAEAGVEEELEWWEVVGAAAASSLAIAALLALAATPGRTDRDASAVEGAYFPWASGLNALLDSLIDLDEDPVGTSHMRRYPSPEVGARRMRMLAASARARLSRLPDGKWHEAIFSAMGTLYLAQPQAWRPGAAPVSRAVFDDLGPLAGPALCVHVLRRRGRGSRALFGALRSPRSDEVQTTRLRWPT